MSRFVLAATVSLVASFGCAPERSDVTVIVSEDRPDLALPCPRGRCQVDMAERPRCSGPTDVVVVSGHSAPPRYLGVSADRMADAIACRRPKLVVLDTCWGASLPLLEALAKKRLRARILGAAFYLPERGLAYGEAFWARPEPEQRAAAVTSPHAAWPLTNLVLSPDDVAEWSRAAEAMPKDELRGRLRHTAPNYIVVGPGVMVEVAPERFR